MTIGKDKDIELIPDPDDTGLLLGSLDFPIDYELPPLGFDLHAADRYIREHNIPYITEEVKKMFRKK